MNERLKKEIALSRTRQHWGRGRVKAAGGVRCAGAVQCQNVGVTRSFVVYTGVIYKTATSLYSNNEVTWIGRLDAQGRRYAPELILTWRITLSYSVGVNSLFRSSWLTVWRLGCHVEIRHRRGCRERWYRSVHRLSCSGTYNQT